MIKLNLKHILNNIDFKSYATKLTKINESINQKTGLGNDYLGWADLPRDIDQKVVERINDVALQIRKNYDTLVVIGIGGSYLGARAAIEAINGLYPQNGVEIVFLGHTLSSTLTAQTLSYLKTRSFAINIISKSGTTTEPSIAFRLVKELLVAKVGLAEANKRIFATTDPDDGALRKLATINGYVTFDLPADVGGRYSVLTPVGLLPIAVAGVNITELLTGAKLAYDESVNNTGHNLYKYAVVRDFLYRKKYAVELFVLYEPQYVMLSEWLKQLYGESEGKEHKGLFPASVSFPTDLHSLGQFIQEGSPMLFETLLYVNEPSIEVTIPYDEENLDELNYIAGKKLSFVNEQAYKGTLAAHTEDGGIPNVVFDIKKLDAKTLGYFFYFFMRSCAVSAYLLDINPFDQPGVEVYKKNMFALLGKKGY